jgi:threonine dehydrogenase-like Zn-dependent dehydrogenase
VIAIDRFPERLELAATFGKAEVLDYERVDVVDALRDLTGGRGADACIDAVGTEAHGVSVDWFYDRAKQALMLETDRPHVLRQVILACRKGGVVSIPGVYGGFVDKVPVGAAFAKGLTFRMGQTHVHRYMRPLLSRVERGEIDPAAIITHRGSLDDAPRLYDTFVGKQDGCVKVVLRP